MIKREFQIVLLLITHFGYAQSPFTFSSKQENYQSLTNAIQVSEGSTWSMSDVTIPLNFDFTLFDHTGNYIILNPYAPTIDLASNYDEISAANMNCVNRNNFDTSTHSILQYSTTGTAGSRICKVEFKNFGTPQSGSNFLNLQYWFYEGSNNIEFRYGQSNFANISSVFPNGGPGIFLWYGGTNSAYFGCSLTGDPVNPTLNQTPNAGYLAGYPSANTVYTFTPVSTTTITTTTNIPTISLYPNPASNMLMFSSQELLQTLEIYSLAGKKVFAETVNSKIGCVDINHLSGGIYIARLKGESFEISQKVAKHE